MDSGAPSLFLENDRAYQPFSFLIYGAGGDGVHALRTLTAAGASIVGFIDQRAAEIGSFHGLPVYRAVLQAYGLRPSKLFDDVDIIMTSRFRRLFGKGLVIVSESAEMHPQNSYDLSDDEIISAPENHFVWRGLKFMRLSLLYRQVKHQGHNESLLIEEFLNQAQGAV